MGIAVYDKLTGKVHKSEDIQLAERVVADRKKKGPWEVITRLVDAWMERSPVEFQAFKVYLDDTRKNLTDPKFAQTNGGKDMDRRLTMIMPQSLMFMIRSIYKPQELIMDKAFYNEFAKRFPFFRIPEKL